MMPDEQGRSAPIVQIRKAAAPGALFDVELYAVGTWDPPEKRPRLTPAQVADLVETGPASAEILFLPPRDDPGKFQEIYAEMRARNRGFVGAGPCSVCKGSGRTGRALCPACSKPWGNIGLVE